jgi:peptidoglycan L-alanyl-D-glutamate endopeptidase CwlK
MITFLKKMLNELLKKLWQVESRTKEEEPQQQQKYFLSENSKRKLIGVHPDLVAVVELAITKTEQDFTVLEGLRTKERQRQLVKKGASQTMNSRHLTGHAVDIAPYVNGHVSWDWDYYWAVEKAMKEAAKELGVPIEWGGNWKSFKDGPHWQLPWNRYK